jgi:hypothetical protein
LLSSTFEALYSASTFASAGVYLYLSETLDSLTNYSTIHPTPFECPDGPMPDVVAGVGVSSRGKILQYWVLQTSRLVDLPLNTMF